MGTLKFVALTLLLGVLHHLICPAHGAELKVQFDTTDRNGGCVDLVVRRGAGQGASRLSLVLTGEGGDRISCEVPVADNQTPVHVDSALLRPGRYTAELTGDGAAGLEFGKDCSGVMTSTGSSSSFRTLKPHEIVADNWLSRAMRCDAAGRARQFPGDDEVSPNQYRLEWYLAYALKPWGVFSESELWPPKSTSVRSAEAIYEGNALLRRLGTVFRTLPLDRGEIAVYANWEGSYEKLVIAVLTGRILRLNCPPVCADDVLDGTLATQHKALIIAGVDELPRRVAAALEAYIAGGGVVLLSEDSKVDICNATRFGGAIGAVAPESDPVGAWLRAAQMLAAALAPKLQTLGFKPAIACDNPFIFTSRQASGDIEYLLAVNAAHNGDAPASVTATLLMPVEQRPIYDAIASLPAEQFKEDAGQLKAAVRFGPGQMRVYARTRSPIGGVDVQTPIVLCDYPWNGLTRLGVSISAAVQDTHGAILAGSAPMHVRVIDPLGQVRYDFYQATYQGVLQCALRLAISDPAGNWRVIVRELLSGKQGSGTFAFRPPMQCNTLTRGLGLVTVTPVSKPTRRAPEFIQSWRAMLPDRALSLRATDGGLTALANDGSLVTLSAAGKITGQEEAQLSTTRPAVPNLPDPLAKKALPGRVVKFVETSGERTAVAYWGGTLEVFDATGAVRASQHLPGDISAVTWLGSRLVVALSDGSVLGLVAR